MHPDEIRDLYDELLAESYERQFLFPPQVEETSAYELSVIAERLGDRGRLLDVACGTGWLLGRFPEHERAGLDLSPSMLARAHEANPGIELREGDFREEQPDWNGRWDVVACMWFAYCYLDTVREVEELIGRMAGWAAPEGCVLLPVCDESVLAPEGVQYRRPVDHYGGELLITGLCWSWRDPANGKLHRDLVAPHVERLLEVFARHFRQVELLRYPGTSGRHAILATARRAVGDGAAEVVRPEVEHGRY